MAACFTPRTIAFLRTLKRHNDREWFKAHKADYETDVRAPLIAVIERLAEDFRTFAPDLIASPRDSLFRIYRDTRFSPDKRPLKTHVAASFLSRRLPRKAGAGLYFHLDPNEHGEVWIGGGTYAPEPRELARIREHIAANHARLRAILERPAFRRGVGGLEGARLQRVPRGYGADHPAADYLRFKQLYAGRSYDIALATSPRFYAELVKVFRLAAPLVAFLNEALTSGDGGAVYGEPVASADPLAVLLGDTRVPGAARLRGRTG